MLSILLRMINSHFSSHGCNILLIVLIILVEYSTTSIHQSINCLSGCKCSSEEHVTAATCCLIDANRLTQIAANNNAYAAIPTDIKLCDINYLSYYAHYANNISSSSNNNQLQWPNTGRCLPLWRQLKIQLTQNSWPTLGAITTARTTSSKCMLQLERLAIVGQMDVYDGLIHLDPYEFRSHLFTDDDGILQLRRLTIEQTSLQKIRPGFFDEIHARNLNSLEIRRNVNLTDKGLGVGWLANVQHLQSLDLSHNNLYTVNFATWGLPKHYTALSNLHLNDNRIYYLKIQSFNRLPNLTYLNLANNYLSSLSSDVFIGLNQLKILDLQGNHLQSHSLILSVSNLDMLLPGLRRLYLSRNPLASLVNSTTKNSNNNNMGTSSQVVWWFTNSCPKLLTSLYLENIGPMNYVKTAADTNQSSLQLKLQLPTFTWEYCESLSDVYLTQHDNNNNLLTCLDRRWLAGAGGGGSLSSSSVSRFRIHPSTLEVCPTNTEDSTVTTTTTTSGVGSTSLTAGGNADMLTKYDTSGGDASLSSSAASMVGTTHLRTTSISLSSVYWPVPTEEAAATAVRVMNVQEHQNTKAKHHPINNNNNNHNLVGGNMTTTSLNSWIILCLIVLLIFVVFSSVIFGIIYCVRCVNQRFSKQHVYTAGTANNNNNGLYLQCQQAQQKQLLLQHHQQQQQNISPNLSNYKSGGGFSMTTGSSQLLIPYTINNCIDQHPMLKTNQLYPCTDFHPMCNSCFSLKRHAITQPVSPADSGLEDSTPLALQQTRHAFPSLDRPSTRASRRSRHHHHQHHNHRHRGLLDPVGFTRCPSTSVSSLLLQHSPNHHCLPSEEISSPPYCWPPLLPSALMNSVSQQRVMHAATSTEDVSIGPASTSPDTSAGDVHSTPSDDAGEKMLSVEKTTAIQCKETETVDIIK